MCSFYCVQLENNLKIENSYNNKHFFHYLLGRYYIKCKLSIINVIYFDTRKVYFLYNKCSVFNK